MWKRFQGGRKKEIAGNCNLQRSSWRYRGIPCLYFAQAVCRSWVGGYCRGLALKIKSLASSWHISLAVCVPLSQCSETEGTRSQRESSVRNIRPFLGNVAHKADSGTFVTWIWVDLEMNLKINKYRFFFGGGGLLFNRGLKVRVHHSYFSTLSNRVPAPLVLSSCIFWECNHNDYIVIMNKLKQQQRKQ